MRPAPARKFSTGVSRLCAFGQTIRGRDSRRCSTNCCGWLRD